MATKANPSADPFSHVLAATHAHRAEHGCGAYSYANGTLLGALAGAVSARRILELGTALGYSALWFAHGAPHAVVDTIERDAEHVRLAREHVEACGLTGHVVVHKGDFTAVLKTLDPGYDMAFVDGFTPSRPVLAAITRLLRTGGLLISANLTHDGSDAYRRAIFDKEAWLSAFVDAEEGTAISVKL